MVFFHSQSKGKVIFNIADIRRPLNEFYGFITVYEHSIWKVLIFNPMLSQGVARSGICWQGLALACKVWQGVARCGKVLQGVARCYKVWKGVSRCYMVSQGVSKCRKAGHGLAWCNKTSVKGSKKLAN